MTTPRTTLRRAAFVLGDAVSLLCLLLIVGGGAMPLEALV